MNASDERGIDIIRNQILQFVKSKNLFEQGLKFVILDEVDYMTKNAQQALKYILQTHNNNVRFCLICNNIIKIDEALKNEFISVRFNQLPKTNIFQFIRTIAQQEQLVLEEETIETIQHMYNSDIRSMINYIQLHQHSLCEVKRTEPKKTCGTIVSVVKHNIMNGDVLDQLHHFIQTCGEHGRIVTYFHQLSIQFNIDKRAIVLKYFNHLIRNWSDTISPTILSNITCVG